MYQAVSTEAKRDKAFLVGICEPPETLSDVREHIGELRELVATLGADVVGEFCASIRERQPRYLVGSGKAEEIGLAASEAHADVIIFDSVLGPSQQRNLERLCHCKVIDRQEVILDIFADRAQTKEAVLQVELARCRYFLPRLTGAWTHLSRQRGGGTGARGEGEKQIELDRRQLKQRISELEEELAIVRKQRSVQRKNRERGRVPHAAIVGYTNAGKSTLLNTLTGAELYAADQLFATLDPTTRKLVLPDHKSLLLTDTVGFVRKLPHSLVEAFKSTLEEAVLADFIVLVLDSSSSMVESHWETTMSVLQELGAERKDMVVVFNKTDLLDDDPVKRIRLKSVAPEAVFVSCHTGSGLEELKEVLMRKISSGLDVMKIEIPPERPELVSLLYSNGRIMESGYLPDGTFSAVVQLAGSCRRTLEPFIKNNFTAPELHPENNKGVLCL